MGCTGTLARCPYQASASTFTLGYQGGAFTDRANVATEISVIALSVRIRCSTLGGLGK